MRLPDKERFRKLDKLRPKSEQVVIFEGTGKPVGYEINREFFGSIGIEIKIRVGNTNPKLKRRVSNRKEVLERFRKGDGPKDTDTT